MVIDVPSDHEPSDVTIIFFFPIEEDSPSPKIQQPHQELETDPMARMQKKPANVVGHTTILMLGSHVVPTPAQRPPIMEPRSPNEPVVGGPFGLPQTRKHKKFVAPINAHGKRPLEED